MSCHPGPWCFSTGPPGDSGHVHRDLKPANVLLDSGLNVKITDFGLAKFVTNVTATGLKGAGTPFFMPPEASSPSYTTECSFDVYSYALLLWSILNMSCRVNLQDLPSHVLETVLTTNTIMRTPPPERPGSTLTFPQSRTSLWDPSPTGDSLSVHLSYYRNPRVMVSEKTLRLAHRHARKSNESRFSCFLLGTVSVDLDEEGVAVSLDRFDPGRYPSGAKSPAGEPGREKVPTALAPGDVCVPCVFVADAHAEPHADSIIQTEAQFHDAFKALHHSLSSRETGTAADLSQVTRLRSEVSCRQTGDRMSFCLRWTCVLPGTTLDLLPVAAVPLIPTALVRNLTSLSRLATPGHTTARSQGFLTMDQHRKLLLMLEMDPKACSLPLVGVWLSGVTHVWSPRVWLFCLRFLFSAALQDRVLSQDGCFLVVVFSQLQRQAQFYQCQPSSSSSASTAAQQNMDYQLLSSTHTFSLYQHVEASDGSSVQCELTSDLHNQQTALFEKTLNSAPPPGLPISSVPPPGLSVSDQDSGVEDGDLSPRPSPKPHPSTQQTPRVQPLVPELSLLLDGSFVGPSPHAPAEPPSLRKSPTPAFGQATPTTAKYGLPPAAAGSSHPGSRLLPKQPAPATLTNQLPSSALHLKHRPSLHPHPAHTPTHHPHPTQAPTHHPHPTQAPTHHPHTTQAPTHHPHPTQAPTHHPHPTQTPSHHPHPTQVPTHHPQPTQTPSHHPHPTQAPSHHPHPAQTPAQRSPPHHPDCRSLGRAAPPPCRSNPTLTKHLYSSTPASTLALAKHLHSTPASSSSSNQIHSTPASSNQRLSCECCSAQNVCDFTPIIMHRCSPPPPALLHPPPPGHAHHSSGDPHPTPDPYRLLVEQDRQLKILQAQIQMLLEAQSKPTNHVSSSAQQTASQPPDQPIRSTVSIAVGTGASLFWGDPVHVPSANEWRREAGPSGSTSNGSKASSLSPASSNNSRPASSNGWSGAGAEESDSRAHQPGFRSPSPHPRCQSPVLGESASMYQRPSPPPPDSTQQFYHHLLNQVNSLLHCSERPEEEEEEEEEEGSMERRRSQEEEEELHGGDATGGINSATVRQLEQLGVPPELISLDASSFPLASISPAALASRLSPPVSPLGGTSGVFSSSPLRGASADMTLEWNAIALRRVPDAQLNRLLPSLRGRSLSSPRPALVSTPHSSTPDVMMSSSSDMSLATRKYMRRYGVLEEEGEELLREEEEPVKRSEVNPPRPHRRRRPVGDETPKRQFLPAATGGRGSPHHTDHGSMGNFLDLSRLRQLPKLF